MRRRTLLQAGVTAGALPGPVRAAATPGTLRVAFNITETGFDPLIASDQVSLRIVSHIFESPLTYDHLARPARLVPQTAAAMPEVGDNFRRFVFTVRPGILFADHPAFGGRPRELVAADYVYSVKRYYDPALRTEHLYQFENTKILGLSELRRRALKARTPFPYDTEVEGLRVLDRYRFELRLAEPAPRFLYLWATPQFTGAVAREVVLAHGSDIAAHPVGTGPFMLQQWRRASRIVIVRNPRFREQRYSSDAPADDADAQAVAASLRGRRLPLLDRVEVDIVEESQPRWLAFLNGEHDVLSPLPPDLASVALPGGTLAPYLKKRGIQLHRTLQATTTHTFFNCEDPVVGGNAAPQVALRRAIVLGFDSAEEIRLVLQGQSEPAQAMIAPHCYGFEPGLRSEMSEASAVRAGALLDLFGYVDRNGDGWRERPDGSPLLLRLAFTPNQRSRKQSELWAKRMRAIGLRMQFEVAPFAELIKRSLAGKLMMWGFSWGAGNPDGDFYLGLAYGPNADQSNDARFRLPAFDRLYEAQRVLPDGPERLALMQRATRLMLAYVPYIAHGHPYANDLMHAHVQGHRRHPFASDWWRTASVS
ncbi:MAG: ABC transporter substrate-binding protein [Rubrivivax sp.]